MKHCCKNDLFEKHHLEEIEQIRFLDKLVKQHNEHPKWAWTLRSRSLFALAYAYEGLKDNEKALELYTLLTGPLKPSDPYVASASKLHAARLSFAALPEEKKQLNQPEMTAILKDLKDLQIRKTLVLEPIHLEAAIDYAYFRASLESHDKQDEQLLFLIKRAKEHFSNQEDLWSKDYSASRKLYPDKDLVYQAYLMLLDADVAYLEGKIAQTQGLYQDAEIKYDIARSLYSHLIHGKFAVSKYLVSQAESKLNLIKPQS